MELLTRLHAYFHTVDPARTIDVIPVTEQGRQPAPLIRPGATETLILACTRDSFHAVAPLVDLHFVVLTQHTPLEAIAEGLDTNARGFDATAPAATMAEALAFRSDLVTNCAFTARMNDVAVAAGMFTPPVHGVAEVVGITTLAPYRRRGIGTALTCEIVRVAFSYGVEIAILRTDNPAAYRIYTRIGFTPAARLLQRSGVENS